jgi:hypothetical protein
MGKAEDQDLPFPMKITEKSMLAAEAIPWFAR